MEINVKNFNLRNTGYSSGDEFKVNGISCYVPFHQNLYLVNVHVNLDSKVGNFKFIIGLNDWISSKERRDLIYSLLSEIEEFDSIEKLNRWIKNLKKNINNNWIENNKEYC